MTSSTVPSPEAFIDSFPHPELPRIEGPPSYETIATMKTYPRMPNYMERLISIARQWRLLAQELLLTTNP